MRENLAARNKLSTFSVVTKLYIVRPLYVNRLYEIATGL